MLTRLKVQNFRSIRELDLRLSPLTALVGPNGSGKSTVLAALDPRSPLVPTWRHLRTHVLVERLDASGSANVSTANAGRLLADLPGRFDLETQHLRLNLDRMRAAIQLNPAHRLEADGNNLANLISTLVRAEQERSQ